MGKCQKGVNGSLEASKPKQNAKRRTVKHSRSKTFGIELDEWQRTVLETEGNVALTAGRQVGKSTVIAVKAGEFAINRPKSTIMIISHTERQAYLIFSKVFQYLDDNYKSRIVQGKDRPTKTRLKLTNGSVIYCLPCGVDGSGIRGYTIDLLIADEAAFIPEDVFPAIIPALSTTGGKVILLSTPHGKEGFFYERFLDDTYSKFYINAETVADQRPEPQRTRMKKHQEEQKKVMSKLHYAQEYLGEFIDDLRRMFSDELIKNVCILKRFPNRSRFPKFLGCDIARMGDDESTFEIISKIDRDTMKQEESIVTTKTLTTATYDKIIELDKQYNFNKIGIDAGSGSLGVGILDFLVRNEKVKRKIVALNNQQRLLDSSGQKKATLLKEDMYINFMAMLESGRLILLDDDEIMESMRSIQYEHVIVQGKPTQTRVFGKYTHIVEGLVRAAWLANQKNLNIWIDTFKI